MSGGILARGDFVLGGFWLGGFCPGGFCPGGLCPGGFCPGGFCPRTQRRLYEVVLTAWSSNYQPSVLVLLPSLLDTLMNK